MSRPAPPARIASSPRHDHREEPRHLRLCTGGISPRDAMPTRAALEGYVRAIFADAYDACPDHFEETLAALTGPGDTILGVIGATRAGERRRLFIEAYLDEPVELAARRNLGHPVCRDRIAQVGNLAARQRGAGLWLVTTLAQALRADGITYAACAATTSLRAAFARLGAVMVDLGPADGKRLGDRGEIWGSYYDTEPRVTLLDVPQLCAVSQARPVLARCLARVWDQARTLGLGRGQSVRASA